MSSYRCWRAAHVICAGVVAMAACLIASSAANAQQADHVGFTTYLREGPGTRYRPSDELLSGIRVDVIGCDNGWCQIRQARATGYVAQSALVVAPEVRALASPSCFVYREAGYHGGRELEMCFDRSAPSTWP